MKKIAIIGTAGVPGKYGGFETLAHHLVKQLNNDYLFTVYNSDKFYSKEERVKYWNKARIHYLPFNANGAQSIIYDIISIIHALFKNDVLLVLGVSGGIILPFIKLFTNKKIIVNIDGLEWRRQKWGKLTRKFLKFSEYLAVKFSHADITDNIGLKRYTSINYETLSHLIEYGANHVQEVKLETVSFKGFEYVEKFIKKHIGAYAMKVCRIEPENNIHVVLEAFSQIPTKHLVIVGNWANSEYGIMLKEKYSHFKNIHLFDPIYNQNILDQLRGNCYVYIHGHSAGGTNPSLVEAMYLGLPVIAYKVVYNEETTENEALYFSDIESLKSILKNTKISKYHEIKASLKEIANRRYTWAIIALKYSNLVKSLYYLPNKQQVYSHISKLDFIELQQLSMLHLKNTKLYFEN